MKRFAVTGTVGAGKSTVLAFLRDEGFPVCSADEIVHDLYRLENFQRSLTGQFGQDIVVHGEVDREALAKCVFANAEDRQWLEQLVWREVTDKIDQWCASKENCSQPPNAVFVEVPLLFEAGMEGKFNGAIVVVADDALRQRRLQERRQSDWEARERLQFSQEEKMKRADVVLENNGSVVELHQQLRSFLDTIE